MSLFDTYQAQIAACDDHIELYISSFEHVTEECPPAAAKKRRAPRRNQLPFDARTHLYQMTGVDLTRLDGIEATMATTLLSEIGIDMTRWPSAKHFASWLGLCPGTKVSGGRRLSSKTKPSANRAAAALRMAASTLYHSQSALGAFHRRMATRLGKAQAVTATAHKLARLVYSLLKNGSAYVDAGQDAYERQYKERAVRNLGHRAKALGFDLVPILLEPEVT